MRWTIALGALLVACGAKQDTGGATFCRSYQDNYLTDCQRFCEGELDKPGDLKGIEKCDQQCTEDLKDDGTFGDSCPKELEKLMR